MNIGTQVHKDMRTGRVIDTAQADSLDGSTRTEYVEVQWDVPVKVGIKYKKRTWEKVSDLEG